MKQTKTSKLASVIGALLLLLALPLQVSAQTDDMDYFRIFPKGMSYNPKKAICCKAVGEKLEGSKKADDPGNVWTLESAGNGMYYVVNKKGAYWSYQGSTTLKGMKCTTKADAVKVIMECDEDGVWTFKNAEDKNNLRNIGLFGTSYNWNGDSPNGAFSEKYFTIVLLNGTKLTPEVIEAEAKREEMATLKRQAGQTPGGAARALNGNAITTQEYLDLLMASSNPEEYLPTLKDALQAKCAKGADRDLLKSAYAAMPEKMGKVSTALCMLLCKTTKDPKEWCELLRLMPTPTAYYAWSENNGDYDAYGNCLQDVVLYPGGRVVMLKADSVQLSGYDDIETLRNDYGFRNVYKYSAPVFVYNPSGDCLLGYMKAASTSFNKTSGNDEYLYPNSPLYASNSDNLFTESVTPDLAAGVKYNPATASVTPYYMGYTTQDEVLSARQKAAAAAAKKEEQQRDANIDRFNNQMKQRLVKKYGARAYNAVNNLNLYVGMPAGILDEFVIYDGKGTQIKLFYKVQTWRNATGTWSTYKFTSAVCILFAQRLSTNEIVYVRNGKVYSTNF